MEVKKRNAHVCGIRLIQPKRFIYPGYHIMNVPRFAAHHVPEVGVAVEVAVEISHKGFRLFAVTDARHNEDCCPFFELLHIMELLPAS